MKHCDEYIDDPAAPACLRVFLARARQPAHGMHSPDEYPKLFATYNGPDWYVIANGSRVRVVMASRLGDVGITTNLNSDHGYQVRTEVGRLSDFSETP